MASSSPTVLALDAVTDDASASAALLLRTDGEVTIGPKVASLDVSYTVCDWRHRRGSVGFR